MIKYIGYSIAFVLVVDLLGFIAWNLSGQVAPDKYHAGIIIKSIINLIK